MEADFLTRLSAYDGTDGAAYPLGRWVAIARSDLQQMASPAVIAAAMAIESVYYRVGDGEEPVSTLVAALLSAQGELAQ